MDSPWEDIPKGNAHQEVEWTRISTEFTNVYTDPNFWFASDKKSVQYRQVIAKGSQAVKKAPYKRALMQVLPTLVLPSEET